jgi:hypothetical protein
VNFIVAAAPVKNVCAFGPVYNIRVIISHDVELEVTGNCVLVLPKIVTIKRRMVWDRY